MKIRNDIIRLYKTLHSTVGICASLFLFIAFYAGGVTMLEPLLQEWASRPEQLPAAVPSSQLDDLFYKARSDPAYKNLNFTIVVHTNNFRPSSFMWILPEKKEYGPKPTVYAGLDAHKIIKLYKRTPSQFIFFINLLHQRIGLPLNHQYGRLIMGVVALFYTIALVSGIVIILPSLARSLFNFQVSDGPRRKWMDFHTLFGVSSLPFHIVIGITALGFAFGQPITNMEKELFQARSVKVEKKSFIKENKEQLLPPSIIVNKLKEKIPKFDPDTLVYTYKENHYYLRVIGHSNYQINRRVEGGFADLDPYTGQITSTDFVPGYQSTAFFMVTLIYALHFGSFGGIFSHLGYTILAFCTAFLFYSGNRMWLAERRRRERAERIIHDTFGTKTLSILTSGITLGCISGISTVLLAVSFFPDGGYYRFFEVVFYSVVLAAVMVSSWLGGERAVRPLLLISGIITLLVPFSSVFLNYHGINDLYWDEINIILFFYAVILIFISCRLYRTGRLKQ